MAQRALDGLPWYLDIHGPHRMNCNNFGDHLTFHRHIEVKLLICPIKLQTFPSASSEFCVCAYVRVCAYSLCVNTCVNRTLVHVRIAVDLRHWSRCVLPLYSIYSAFYLNWQWQFRIRKCFPSLRCTCTYWFMAENSNSWSRIAEERPKGNRKANSLLKWGFTARWSLLDEVPACTIIYPAINSWLQCSQCCTFSFLTSLCGIFNKMHRLYYMLFSATYIIALFLPSH